MSTVGYRGWYSLSIFTHHTFRRGRTGALVVSDDEDAPVRPFLFDTIKMTSLSGGEIIGIGNDNCISRIPGTNTIFRMDMLIYHSQPPNLSEVQRLLKDESRFSVNVYTVLVEEQFKKQYPIAYADLLECYTESEKDKTRYIKGLVYFSKGPYLTPIQHLTLEDASYLRESLRIMHESKIIHGDLHEGNILRYNGLPVIIDFDGAEINPKEFVAFQQEDQKHLEEVIHYYSKKYLILKNNSSIVVSIKSLVNQDAVVQDRQGNTHRVRTSDLLED
jgi:hypothetical protein